MKRIVDLIFLLMLVLPITHGIAGDEIVITNRVAGISMSKPDEWKLVRVGEVVEKPKRLSFNAGEFKAAILARGSWQTIAMSKFSESPDGINPSIKVTVGPSGAMQGMQPLEIAKLLLPLYQRKFPNDFVVVVQPVPATVAGFEASYAQVSFSSKPQGGRKTFMTSELWVVPRGEYLFLVEAATEKDERTGSRKEIQDIVKTIRMAS